MVDVGIVTAKLVELAGRVGRVRAHAKATVDELASDRDAQDLVAFNLMLAVQTCADLATHLVADEGWPAARSLREAFERLHENGVVSADTARAMSRAVGLRNVVAHGYAGVDVAMLHAASHAGLADLERLSGEVAAWVKARASSGATDPPVPEPPDT